jgi:hypothetical protein
VDLNLTHFADSELDENEVPVIGFDLTTNPHVLNYTLEFTDIVDTDGAWIAGNALETTEITMLGRTYYVVSARNTTSTDHKITLLDTANSATVTEGETTSLSVAGKSYDVSIDYVSSTETILIVNGVQTNKLGEGDVFKVEGDLYVAVKDVLYNAKDIGISKVSISLGSGKIVLENAAEVEINNEDISTLTDSILNTEIAVDGNDLDSITLEWILDDDAWIIPGRDLVLPGFETIKLSMGGFNVAKKEVTKVLPDGDSSIKLVAPIKDGEVSLNLFYLNSSNDGIIGLGEKETRRLVTSNDTDPLLVLSEANNSYFVATWISGDDSESYAFELTGIEDDSGKNKTTLKNLASGAEVVFSEVGKIKDIGSLQLTLAYASDTLKVVNISLGSTSGATYSDQLVTAAGLRVQLPVLNQTGSTAQPYHGLINISGSLYPTTWAMNFTEETKDGDIDGGRSVVVDISTDSNDGLEPHIAVYATSGVTMLETGDSTDQYEGYVVSNLATRFFEDKPTSGLNDVEIEYHDTEASADVFISEAGAAVVSDGTTSTTKVLPITDTEAATVAAKNLVVVGGSCINSVAADLLGGALCGADFEAKTGVGAGAFLIKTYSRAGGGVATLVAGYNAEDTTSAAKYLTTKDVDTTVGVEVKKKAVTFETLA